MAKKRAEVTMKEALVGALEAGTSEHYEDAALYDHEYRQRLFDVSYYRELAAGQGSKGSKGSKVLELGCGSGRLLIPLVRDGHRVTGVDLSASMLAECQAALYDLPDPNGSVGGTLVEGDFRNVKLHGRWPLVVCPFNAVMHLYSRTDVEGFLATVKRHLAKDGLFAFDVMFPDLKWLSRDPDRRWARTRFRHPRTGQTEYYSTSLTFDAALQIAFVRIFYTPADPTAGPERVVHLTHRHFFPQELAALLHYNGFDIVRHDGGFVGERLEPGCDQQVLQCRVSSLKSRK